MSPQEISSSSTVDAIPAAERRVLQYIVFHSLRRALEQINDSELPSEQELEAILIDTISLLPRLGARKGHQSGKIELYWFQANLEITGADPRSSKASGQPDTDPIRLLFDIQPAMDSLRIVWQDYLKYRQS
ncbi:MAG: hypothetical protein KDK39_18815 [Leptospiraceae bacterium]|nr:hypothetical protein [Leptospiraceae bacterium]